MITNDDNNLKINLSNIPELWSQIYNSKNGYKLPSSRFLNLLPNITLI